MIKEVVLQAFKDARLDSTFECVSGVWFCKNPDQTYFHNLTLTIGTTGLQEFVPGIKNWDENFIYQSSPNDISFPSNAHTEYDQIELRPTLNAYLDTLRKKYRYEVRKAYKFFREDCCFTIVKQIPASWLMDFIINLGWDKKEYTQFLFLNLSYTMPFSYAVLTYKGAPAVYCILYHTEDTLYNLSYISVNDDFKWAKVVAIAQIEYAIDKGFRFYDMENIITGNRTAYKRKFFNAKSKIPVYANNLKEDWLIYDS